MRENQRSFVNTATVESIFAMREKDIQSEREREREREIGGCM